MFKNLKLGARIGLGFAALVALMCFLGGSNAWQMNTAISQATRLANEYVPESEYATAFDSALLDVQLDVRSYGLTYDDKYLNESNAALAECKESYDALKKLSGEYPALVKLAEALPQIDKNFREFEAYIAQTADLVKALTHTQDQMNTAAGTWAKNVEEFQASQAEALKKDIETNVGVEKLNERAEKVELVAHFRNLGNQVRIAAWKAQAERDPSIIQGVLGKFDEMNKAVEQLRPLVHTQQNTEELNACAAAANDYKKAVDALIDDWTKLQAVGAKRAESASVTGTLVKALAAAAIEQSTERAHTSRDGLTTAMYILIAGLGVAIVIGALLGWFITRGITKPVNRIIASLTDGSNQVNDASRQVASASQQLAAGASEQASSLEETSSALEEMAAMTRTNAANSEKANNLAGQARKNATDGEKTMGELNNAMTAINDSAAQIGKIIKVIEEIAFQTNLLALNAAVEAARAGEHGKGFAVVAEEVRNLAQRSAQAARDTTNLIEGAVTRAKEGTSVASNAAKSLNAIVADVANVAELLAGISRASNEQAQGVDQINSAVSQMDKVTQQNAAGAEESASAAEQLSAQSETVKSVVDELTSLVRGTASGHGGPNHAARPATRRTAPAKTTSAAPKTSKVSPATTPSSTKHSDDEQFAALAQSAQSFESPANGSSDDLGGF